MKYLRVFKSINDYENEMNDLPYQCISCIKENNKKPLMAFPKYTKFVVKDGALNVQEGVFFVLGSIQ